MCYVSEVKEKNSINFKWKIRDQYNCDTENVVYMIECEKEKCRERYIGESYRKIRERFTDHRSYVNNNNQNQATIYPI